MNSHLKCQTEKKRWTWYHFQLKDFLSLLLHSSGSDVTEVGSLPSFPRARRPYNGTRSGSTRAPVRATSGTFVPHGSERTLRRYLTAPVTLPPPLRTCCVRVRDCTRARVCRTWLYARSHVLHSSVTLPRREDMCRSLSQVHCQQLWAGVCRFFFKFTVRSFSLCWLRWICCIFAKIFPPLSANISPHATCQHFLLPFRGGDFGITPYIWRSVPCLNKFIRKHSNLIGKRLSVFQERTPYCLTHLSKGIADGKFKAFHSKLFWKY